MGHGSIKPVSTQILINPKWCKHCGICAHYCPQKVLEYREGGPPVISRTDKCSLCYLCVLRCPDFAIKIREERDG